MNFGGSYPWLKVLLLLFRLCVEGKVVQIL